jgi:hypothetical protein
MQERYLGDSHDFIKYALLRHLRRTVDVRIGVNWYLTRPEDVDKAGNNDGEKRHHLNDPRWSAWDSDLHERLRPLAARPARKLEQVKESGLLPDDTQYFAEHVPTTGRAQWHAQAVATLGDSDLIFLDPDNGFEVGSMTARSASKYALYEEAIDFYRRGKVVVGIQFIRQADPIQRGRDIREKLHAGLENRLPIVRGRVAPNILFFTLASPDKSKQVAAALTEFAANSPLRENGTGRRVELIL